MLESGLVKIIWKALVGITLVAVTFFAGTQVREKPEEPRPVPKKKESKNTGHLATVLEVSPVVDGALGAYPNCLIALRCKGGVAGLDGEFTVFLQLLDDHEKTDAARISKGMKLALAEAIPFDEAPERIQSMQNINTVGGVEDPWLWVPTWEAPGMRGSALPPVVRALAAQRSFLVRNRDPEFFFYGGDRAIYQPAFYYPGKRGGVRKVIDEIVRFGKELAERDIKLFILIAPQTSSIYPGLATGVDYNFERDGAANFQLAQAMGEVSAGGVSYLDLTRFLHENRWFENAGRKFPSYLPNDTHWAPNGARLAAEKVAESVGGSGAARFRAEEEWVTIGGDVRTLEEARYLQLDVQPVETVAFRVVAEDPAHAAWLECEDIQSSVHVLGDSYVNAHGEIGSSFSQHLVRALGEPVYEVAVDGGGPAGARERWVAEGGYEHARAVVWVIAERYAGFHDLWARVAVPPR